uniref:Epstein-Barr virus EBNA-1-like protein n=1 Tax=Oryza sativa subsp. japonica TaxID=39947 RepID=Q69RP7_ORYSJ|nr:Epstein-Barr virus EBNA-1-like protein [Oryza sativa Japonica Group]
MGWPALEGGPKARAGERGRGSRWAGSTSRGPEWDPLVGGSAHRAEEARDATLGFGRGAQCTRAAGPRIASRLSLAPTWRLRGCHAGRREEDDDAAVNGRRTVAAAFGAKRSDAGKGKHTGRFHGTRGDEPTARICRRGLDGGGLRRQPPAAR